MKSVRNLTKKLSLIAVLLTLTFILSPAPSAYPADMANYCITPPFVVGGGVQPNLLLTIDNSASMYDMAYIDNGKLDLSTDPPTFLRDPLYCYDQTYRSTNAASGDNPYVGNFQNGTCSIAIAQACTVDADCPQLPVAQTCNTTFYSYKAFCSITNNPCFSDSQCPAGEICDGFFETISIFPAVCDRSYSYPDTLCVNIDNNPDPSVVTSFAATGNYLNWLTASKFDIQKEILTGGKYLDKACDVTTSTSCDVDSDCPATESCLDIDNHLMNETRGCVGRRFIKAPLNADFQNYDDVDADPNIPNQLSVTFGVNGPRNPSAPSVPSNGGQTYLELFEGKFKSTDCQDAVKCFDQNAPCTNPETNAAVKKCIAGDGGYCQADPAIPCIKKQDCPKIGTKNDVCVFGGGSGTDPKVIFQQAVQECWQHLPGNNPDSGWTDAENIKSMCPDIYKLYEDGFCSDSPATACNLDTDCPPAEVCINGPRGVLPGNPAYVCSLSYTGKCYTGGFPAWDNSWEPDGDPVDPDSCIVEEYKKFCGDVGLPPVIDPTDDPSDTSTAANLPAIISDIGVEGQLGKPIAKMIVKVKTVSEPEGLIQQYDSLIRLGAMTFNFNGTESECVIDPTIPCPKVCSGPGHSDLVCTNNFECPDYLSGETCEETTVVGISKENKDGAQIVHYIGTPGECSVTTTDSCTSDLNCPDGETCKTGGDHTKGLVRTIDNIRADSWTPFSEAFYEAIGYFARMSPHKPIVELTGTITQPIPSNSDCQVGDGSGLSRVDHQLSTTDYCKDTNPSQYRCQSNNILLISDGMSTADLNNDIETLVATYPFSTNPSLIQTGTDLVNNCPKYSGSRSLDDLAWIAQNRDITDFSVALDDGSDQYKSINTFALYNGAASIKPGECNTETLLREASQEKGGGVFKMAENPKETEKALVELFETLAAKASSGTAASVLASGSGEGANLLQAIFYPQRFFTTTSSRDDVDWIGTLQNLWYYVDPRFGASAIREDTDGDNKQHLIDDLVISYAFRTDKTVVDLYKDDGDASTPLVLDHTVDLEFINNLWEAGTLLWQRDINPLTGIPRTVKTAIDDPAGTGDILFDFKNNAASIAQLMPYLQAADEAEAEAIIRFTHGEDTRCVDTTALSTSSFTACSYDSDCVTAGELCAFINPAIDEKCSVTTATSCTQDSDCPAGETCNSAGNYRTRTVRIDLNNDDDVTDAGEEAKVWKLGDIINSTPKVLSWVPINNYADRYGDNTYKKFTCDDPFDTCDSGYEDRGMIFTSANDGMLHAFKLGKLELDWEVPAPRDKNLEFARLTNTNPATPLGHEEWAFIPKNALPYLKYVGDPGYCHLYINDGSPVITDASLGGLLNEPPTDPRDAEGKSWNTVLIGSMRYGGACKNTAVAGASCNDLGGDCVNTPVPDLGYSSYFALDITNPKDPKFMWEFSDPALGFATPGASFIRINAKDNGIGDPVQYTNGHWFVLLPSGPTGPIDKTYKQFLARSDQNLKLFVLDLKTGALMHTIDTFGGSVIPNAFGGSSIQAGIDYDNDYQDDILYIPYIKSDPAKALPAGTDSWTDGGITRIYTKGSNDPTTWVASKLMDGIGAVSSAVDELKNRTTGKLWLFFGTGRYFFKKGKDLDDPESQRRIFGVREPCFNTDGKPVINTSCDTTINVAIDLQDVSDIATAPDATKKGWYINLQADPTDLEFEYERVTTDPVATASQVVFFTTFRPSSDICSFGGSSHLWGVKYDTGGCADGLLQGKALIQVSTGTIEQIDLKDVLSCTPPDDDDDTTPPPGPPDVPRRSPEFTGKPPEGPGLILITAPPPEERFMHIRER